MSASSTAPTARARPRKPPSSAAPSRPPLLRRPPIPGGGLARTARYTVTNQWPGGFQGEVRVTAGTSAIKGWTVTWTFADGQTVDHAWNAEVTSSGSTVTARNASYNDNLGAGASASFGFTASSGSANNAPTASCTAS